MIRKHALLSSLALTLGFVACSKAEEPAAAPAPAKAEAAAESAPQVEPVFAAYERARAQLADDQADVAAVAGELEKAARDAAAGAPAKAKPHLEALAGAAKQLGTTSGGDIEAIRLAYGDVSKHLVALVAAYPALGEKRHVFECPMAKGYQKWVQVEEEMANPYMGKAMLACGMKSKW